MPPSSCVTEPSGSRRKSAAERIALLVVHVAGDEAALAVDLAVVHAGCAAFRARDRRAWRQSPVAKSSDVEPVAQRHDGAARLAQRQRADVLRHAPASDVRPLRRRSDGPSRRGCRSSRAAARRRPTAGLRRARSGRRRCSSMRSMVAPLPLASLDQNATLSPPLSSRISRASAGRRDLQAQPLDDLARAADLLRRCSRRAGPGRPTGCPPARPGHCRPWPPPSPRSASGCGRRPAPTSDSWSPNRRSAVRFMCMHVLGMRADAAQDAEHGLDEQRRLDQPAVEEMGEVVEVADVVALELEPGAVLARRCAGCTRCPGRCS